MVYVIRGACDITHKDQTTKKISFEWAMQDELSEHLTSTLDYEINFMTKKHPAAKVVFCPLVGLELGRVVNAHCTSQDQQLIVNEAVFTFNTKVFATYRESSTFSPALHRTIHRTLRGTKKSYYHYLKDGIHLTEDQKDK